MSLYVTIMFTIKSLASTGPRHFRSVTQLALRHDGNYYVPTGEDRSRQVTSGLMVQTGGILCGAHIENFLTNHLVKEC